MLTRYRVQLIGDRTRDVTRLERMLEDASIKLSAVAASLSTVSARAMLEAMVAGQRDPAVLADMDKGKMRGKIPDLREALPPRLVEVERGGSPVVQKRTEGTGGTGEAVKLAPGGAPSLYGED